MKQFIISASLLLCLSAANVQAQRALQKNPTTGALIEGFKSGANTLELDASGTLKFTSGFTLTGSDVFKQAAGLVIGTDVQQYTAHLDAIATIGPGDGVLTNDGLNGITYTARSTGGNGTADDGLIPIYGAVGDLTCSDAFYIGQSGVGVMTLTAAALQSLQSGLTCQLNFPAADVAIDLPAFAGTLIGTGNLTAITAVGTLASGSIPATLLTGTLAAARMPALTGDITSTAGSVATTLASTLTFTGKTVTGGTFSALDALSIKSTTSTSRKLSLVSFGALTGDRTLSIVVGNADRFLSLSGDVYLSGITTTGTGTLATTASKTFTFSNTLTLTGTDGSTLNIGGGGILGTAAYTASSAYEVPLTFSTGLTRSTNTVTVNDSQNIATLSNLTSNGFVKTSGSTGALSVDTNTYITGVTGTANEITVTGTTTPTISIPSAVTFTGKTITGGTYATAAFNGTLGATTPSTVVGTTGTFNANTASTSTTTGTVIVTGGVGISGKASIGTIYGYGIDQLGDGVLVVHNSNGNNGSGTGAQLWDSWCLHWRTTNSVGLWGGVADTLEIRNATTPSRAQTLRVYGNATGKYAIVTHDGTTAIISSSSGGTKIGTAGSAINNIKRATCTLVAGTATVSDTDTTANTHVSVMVSTSAGTIGTGYKVTVTAGTGYTITAIGSVLETSTLILKTTHF